MSVPGTLFNRFQLSKRHLSRQDLSLQHLSISGIFQLLLPQFWANIKCRFLEPSSTDANCHGDICPTNIYPGNICPCRNISLVSDPILSKIFGPKFFGALIFLTKILSGPKYWTKFCLNQIFLDPQIFNINSFWHKFWIQNFVAQIFFYQIFF